MPIRDAVNMNTLGTNKVLKLADGMVNLEVGTTELNHYEYPLISL